MSAEEEDGRTHVSTEEREDGRRTRVSAEEEDGRTHVSAEEREGGS